ncbi:MAG TPA: HAD-IIIA family hydrolase [Sphingobacterium sp.]|nr:HAD-IIIA family hydrolase [Sphingobacterium sp.]
MILSKFKNISCLVLDVDGVLTDGRLLVTESGEFLRSFNVKDGYAIKLAVKKGLQLWVISGGTSEGVRIRMEGLGISEVHLGISDKLSLLQKLAADYNTPNGKILFVGDDIPDMHAMQWVGLSACPADAVEEIKQISDFVSPYKGGEGMIRDLLEKTLKLQGRWAEDQKIKST